MRMHDIVVCSLSGSTKYFHIISYTARFAKESYWSENVLFDFLSNFFLKYFSFQEEASEILSKMYDILFFM